MHKHLLCSILACLFTARSLPAQTWQWAEQGISDYTSFGRSITADDAGNLYASGSFYGYELTFGTHTLINDAVGYAAAYLVKYDTDGNALWAAGSEGDGSEEVAGIATDGAGNTVVCGQFGFYGTFMSLDGNLLDCAGGSDGFIARHDPAGAVQWVLGFGGEGNDGVTGVALDSDGNIFATGLFRSDSISFGAFTLHNQSDAGHADLFVVELDPDGNVIWALSEGAEGDDIGAAIAIDATGNVIVTGSFEITVDLGGTLLTSLGGTDACVLKYTTSGDPVWAKKIGGGGNDLGEDVATDNDGNIYVAGNFEGTICLIGTTYFLNTEWPLADVFIAKYDPNGSVVWARHGGGWGVELIGGICMDAENQLHVAGYFDGDTLMFASTDLVNSDPGWGYTDIFMVTYDADGGLVNAEHPIGLAGFDEAHDVAADLDGNVIIAGYFTCPELIFDGNVVVDPDEEGEPFIAKLGAITTDVPLHGSTSSMGIYPNPAAEQITVLSSSTGGTIALYDPSGRVVLWSRATDAAQRIDISALTSGCYVVERRYANGDRSVGRFMK